MPDSGQRAPEDSPEANLATVGSTAVSGVAWVGATKVLRHGLQYLLQIVLARLLFPEDFGVFGEVLIFLELGVLLNEMGMSVALIQRKELTREDVDTAFWAILAFGGMLLVVFTALAGPIAGFFGKGELRSLIVIGCLAFPLSSAGTVPISILSREMRFRRLFIPEIGGAILGSGLAIALALLGAGAASLVWGYVATAGMMAILSMFSARWWPRLTFDWDRLRNLFTFSSFIVGRRLVDFIGASLTYVLIARILGEADAGIYFIISRLAILPQVAFSSILGRVALSAFSRVQNRDERIRQGFLLMSRYIALLATPVLITLSALSEEVLVGLYGDKWIAGTIPLTIFAWMGLINAAVSQPGVVWVAKGRVSIPFYWAILMSITLVGATLAGLRWGLLGVSVALALRSLVFFPIPPLITNRLIDLSPRRYYAEILPYLGAGGIVWLELILLRKLFIDRLDGPWFSISPNILRLVLLGAIGLLSYAILVRLMRPRTREEIQRLFALVRKGGDEPVEP